MLFTFTDLIDRLAAPQTAVPFNGAIGHNVMNKNWDLEEELAKVMWCGSSSVCHYCALCFWSTYDVTTRKTQAIWHWFEFQQLHVTLRLTVCDQRKMGIQFSSLLKRKMSLALLPAPRKTLHSLSAWLLILKHVQKGPLIVQLEKGTFSRAAFEKGIRKKEP